LAPDRDRHEPGKNYLTKKSENSCLHQLIKKYFKNCYIGFLFRKNFAEDFGKNIYIQSGNKDMSSDELNTKYVCMASLSGLVTYIETNSTIVIEKGCINIKYFYLENHLNIPFQSTIELELLLNAKFNKMDGSLFSLYTCQTVSGFRLLRSNILQPLAIKDDIVKRHSAIEELIANHELLFQIKNNLSLFKDLEISISKFMHKLEEPTENIIKQLLTAVKSTHHCLQNLENLKDLLKYKFKSELMIGVLNCFEDKMYQSILNKISSLIEDFDDSGIKITRKQDSIFFMIKAGVNNLLDVSRKTYSDTINEIYAEYEKLKVSTNDPNIKLSFSESKGYYILISERYYKQEDFILAKKVGRKYSCSNIPLLSLSERIKEIKRDLVDISMRLMVDLISMLQGNINYLYVLSSYIALLDVLCAFTDYSINTRTSKPIIDNNKSFPFYLGKNCRHPIIDMNMLTAESQFVPNDYFMTSHFNILLLRGANASGKTTYMKQLALLTIMAQIGCFIPGDYFEFTLRKFLYSKFSNNDNLEEGKGKFIEEITEVQKVISNNHANSLILLDEPFDNSNTKENFALSIAILDSFTHKYNKSFIVISSHNHSLSQLGCFYFNIMTATMEVEYSENSMTFLYKFRYNNPIKLIDSLKKDSLNDIYGVILANMLGYDDYIIQVKFINLGS
jgi:DNA mismatch repair protein MSH4